MTTLFDPLSLRGVTLPNRIVIPPMCQYSAKLGFAEAWHMVQYGRFAVGGAGTIIVEATAVSPEGRITHGDLGIWSDEHAERLAPIAQFIRSQNAVPAIQLAHAGGKASTARPWHGSGAVTDVDAISGEKGWDAVAPSAIPFEKGYRTPVELDQAGLDRIRTAFTDAAKRADAAGFDIVEIHNAHGYLLHSFLSPISNHRTDEYGGDAKRRMRYPLEVAQAVRDVFPKHKPVFVRLSVVDGGYGGRQIEESIAFAAALKQLGIDVLDCSSGGLDAVAGGQSKPKTTQPDERVPRGYGFQVPFAERIRHETGIPTIAVGLVVDAHQANQIVADGRADLVAIGRQTLANPNWALDALATISGNPRYADRWPEQHGWWLDNREKTLTELGKYEAGNHEAGAPVDN